MCKGICEVDGERERGGIVFFLYLSHLPFYFFILCFPVCVLYLLPSLFLFHPSFLISFGFLLPSSSFFVFLHFPFLTSLLFPFLHLLSFQSLISFLPHLFPLPPQVQQQEEEAKQRKMQEEMWTMHVDRCRLLGHDPYLTPIFDPTYQYFWDPVAANWQPYTGSGEKGCRPSLGGRVLATVIVIIKVL